MSKRETLVEFWQLRAVSGEVPLFSRHVACDVEGEPTVSRSTETVVRSMR